MNIKNYIFLTISICLIFNYIPVYLQPKFLAGPLISKLVFYPLFIGYIYTFYQVYKRKMILNNFDIFKKFLLLYLIVMLTSFVLGLFNYPFFDVIYNAPKDQIEKLPMVVNWLNRNGIDISPNRLIIPWYTVRIVKSFIFNLFYFWGGAYMIYLWYKDDWRLGIRIFSNGVIISIIVLALYGVIEIFHLGGNSAAKEFLVTITPYMHPVKMNGEWWPPLIWENQLRFIFPEPSHVGNYLAFAIPILWARYLEKRKFYYVVLSSIFAFFVFLTNARTAYAMMFGTLFLFSILLAIKKKKELLFGGFCIILSVSIGFSGALVFKNEIAKVNNKKVTATDLIDDNLMSLTKENRRSNSARYAMIKSNFRVFLKYPILGVGNGLSSVYAFNNLNEVERENLEVKSWIKTYEKEGPLSVNTVFGNAFNEYVNLLTKSGIVGFCVFLMPFSYVLFRLLKIFSYIDGTDLIYIIMLITSLLATLVSGCNFSLNIFYAIWILLGLGYTIITSYENTK